MALCIGNDNYSILPKLDCAKNDSTEIANALKRLGFDTKLVYDLNRAQMVDVITAFTDELREYDSCVFYYAGHGFQIDGDNILAPIELNISERNQQVKMNAFPLEELMHQLQIYPDKTKIIILDACRSTLNNRGIHKGFAPVLAPQGTIIAFSTSPGQSSSEHTASGHGYYTEALLKYIELPRVHIETVFKKTRESLVAELGDKQIPWEHTSLIGDYYLNPNTIYDGVHYSPDALADSQYHTNSPEVRKILEGLKSHNWPLQRAVIPLLKSLKFDSIEATDLFVIGRNIYQAADGNCYDIRIFIDNFANIEIPDIAKLHLLNGMGYEIYFDSKNNLRVHPKSGYYIEIIRLLEMNEFYESRTFITSTLCRNENQIIYIPGQNNIMTFDVEANSDGTLRKIIYRGQNVLLVDYNNNILPFITTSSQLTIELAKQIVAPPDCVRVNGLLEDTKICLPYSFTIRNSAINTEE